MVMALSSMGVVSGDERGRFRAVSREEGVSAVSGSRLNFVRFLRHILIWGKVQRLYRGGGSEHYEDGANKVGRLERRM